MTTPAAAKRVALAAVAGAHGIKGELRLKLFAEGIASLTAQDALWLGDRQAKLVSVREGGKFAVARFQGVSDRGAAEALRGTLVEIERYELPPLEEGEYYHGDLVGLAVVDTGGNAVGTVVEVANFGASDVIEIEKPGGKRFMVPLTEVAVPEWNDERLLLNPEFVD